MYFKVSIDHNLFETILPEMDKYTTIFGAGGLMELITTSFDSIYPLASRRISYFKLKQESDQPFSIFSNKLKQIGNEADLNTIQKEELHIFRYITGCSDKKLRCKFLELVSGHNSDDCYGDGYYGNIFMATIGLGRRWIMATIGLERR